MSLKNLDDTRRTDVVLEHRYDHGMVWFWECRNVDQLVTTYDHISNENIKILKKKNITFGTRVILASAPLWWKY